MGRRRRDCRQFPERVQHITMAERSLTDCGERLRRARETRGISLRQVANVTRITVRALEAVERNDLSRLPGGIFTRAFVRAYAAEVGLDPEVTLREFLAQCPEEGAAVPTAAPHSIGGGAGTWRERVPFRRIAIAVLLLALAGVAAYAAVRWSAARWGPRTDRIRTPLEPHPPVTASASAARLP
jgi:cytoskeletal protein RodZ